MLYRLKLLLSGKNSKKERVRAKLEIDISIVFIMLGLLTFGWVMVTSASMIVALDDYNNPYFYSIRQGFFAIIAIFLFLLALLVPTKNYEKNYNAFFFVMLIVLVAVLVPGIGKSVNGARRWIPLLIINIQVAELAKLLAIIFFSGYIAENLKKMANFKEGILRPITLLGCIAILLLMQPDFGSTVVISICVMGMLFVAGNKVRWYGLLLGTMVMMAAMLVIISPYRMHRITGFLHPWENANGSGYQLVQALISFGRGGWFGDGFGNGIQKQFFLPEAHTDFITSVIAEELGVVGLMVLLAVYLFIVFRAMSIAKMAFELNRYYQAFLAYGVGFWIAFQVFVNIGVNTGLLPTKGLTLPLISYGGSSLLIMCYTLSVLVRVDFENKLLADTINPRYIYKKVK
ncbi:putative lipid II flippase FtsW [Francisella tularensis subsp. holarctica FSC022]|uniref:putative lipid II flippase FtsW n=1 Tax=Francisella tularensis TaxID=263 RepID=UPI00015D7A98|nr:putative lipid II flippase FtsW [Francisella tularensis]EDO66851.1 cell division protein FtsW [Francisella tularensis subsp. holarctica FSC022]KIP31598.1 cell division protein FtsW [Francisella tularensis subsp. holarctica]MCC9172280.1 putative lipid II flippase FtsW [Francisella tularensis]OCQ63201.1 cell division protein FtsW [Francisella tularensis]OPH22924.1 putative lipid II flippase FtsW [Francisella tularensis subsp. holarctica FSC022]